MRAKVLKNILVSVGALGAVTLVTVLSLLPPDLFPQSTGWFSWIPCPDKVVHFGFYFLMVSAVRFAKTFTTGYNRSCPGKLLIFAALYGGMIEILQGKYFGRGCDIWDEVANILGAVTAIWLIPQRWHESLAGKLGRHNTAREGSREKGR